MNVWPILGRRGREAGELWQGSQPTDEFLLGSRSFHVVALCAQEYQPTSIGKTYAVRTSRDAGTRELLLGGFDDSGDATMRDLILASRMAHRVARRVRMGKRVLTTCMAGRNRSGLTNALAVVLLTGCSGPEAREIVRQGRPGALANPVFASFLEQVKGPKPLRRGSPGIRL